VIRAVMAMTAAVGVGLCGGAVLADGAIAGTASGIAFTKPLTHSWISLGFGCTGFGFEPADHACPGGHWHSGVDLAAARGTPVIDHGGGLASLYGHLDTVVITPGAYVLAGQVIGTVGSTGNATGPHLHFEIRRDGIAEDPRQDMMLP
jgi:murein DD-endopeptidase MepM/ murein hydrolase activator NlpD